MEEYAMSTAVLSAPQTMRQDSSLATVLEQAGFRVIPAHLVKAHKHQMVLDHRKSLGKLLPVVLMVRFVLTSFYRLCCVVTRKRVSPQQMGNNLLIGSLFGVVCFLVGAFAEGDTCTLLNWLGVAGCTPFMNAMMLLFVAGCAGKDPDDMLSHWERTPRREFRDVMPVLVCRTANRAAEIPGVRLEVEHFNKDPFLCAVRGHFFWTERCYIAAWYTGDPTLDSY